MRDDEEIEETVKKKRGTKKKVESTSIEPEKPVRGRAVNK